jgi:hypothetical protein
MKKTRIFLVLAALVALFTATSCLDGYDINDFNVNYGVIKGNQQNFYIQLDNKTTLEIVANQVPWFQVKDGQRIIADYTILGETTPFRQTDYNSIVAEHTRYKVRLNYLYNVLTKLPVNSTFISTPARQDSIGHDKIDINDAWIGSNFLNVNFSIFRSHPNIKHFINIVIDEDRSSATDIYMTMRHNAYNDFQDFYSFGRVSFDISNILDQIPLNQTINLHICWKNYYGHELTEKITYTKTILQTFSNEPNIDTKIVQPNIY